MKTVSKENLLRAQAIGSVCGGGSSMSKVKIVSNPYRRSTVFLSWDGEAWNPVDSVNNPNSQLLSRQFSEGFFPFKSTQIVEVILSEYGGGAPIEIEFEGPDDEWAELVGACDEAGFSGRVALTRGSRTLANARDILPFVRDEFDGVYPIIAGQTDGRFKAQELLRKFRDASSDVVPICVVGNYSSGKSTFINALIGAELLPSSDRPLTARVFRIERSDQSDRASITLDYSGGSLRFWFGEKGVDIDSPASSGQLAEEVSACVRSDDAAPVIDRVRKALTVINKYKPAPEEGLGDLVEVRAPFREDGWMRDKKLVIFDTPGSNSNSNARHLEVLKEAMRGMSDGLPIYVTEYSSLDSNDNAELYDEIREIEALDERFAMVVVNKADTADLPEDNQSQEMAEYVLNTPVVRNLYAHGVYYVSSIMGLGAKTGGDFADRHYDRCFRQLLSSYDDPEDRYYTRLYRYDLMPRQLQKKALVEAEGCSNHILANSGLFCVQRGIEDFATKYSVYNKCSQSDALLHELIEDTDEALEGVAERVEESRRLGQDDLDASKGTCLNNLREESASLRTAAIDGYLPYMNERNYLEEASLNSNLLRLWEKDFSETRQNETGVGEKGRMAAASRAAVGSKLRERAASMLDSRDLLGLGSLVASFANDVTKALESHSEEMDARREADRAVSEDLLGMIRGHFDAELGRAIVKVEQRSREYWGRRSEEARAALLGLISNGEGIDEDRRDMLRDIIIDFRPLSLSDSVPEIKEIRNPFDPNKLWKAPITIQHNLELSRRVSRWRSAVEPAHEDSYTTWLNELTDKLAENIVDLNPELKRKLDFIKQNERELADLQVKRDRLRRAEERVSSFMSWRGED